MSRTVETVREINVNWCNREGLLEPGASGSITWSNERTGEETGSVAYAAAGDEHVTALRLSYTIQRRRESREVSYEVPIEWTECHFGGSRPWFCCPACGDRVGKLYASIRYVEYVCRACEELRYESQISRSPMREAVDRLEEARRELDGGRASRENLREYYDALSGQVDVFNAAMNALDDKYGSEHLGGDRGELNTLPPFEVWLDRKLSQLYGSEVRPYNRFGRCTATAKTTAERCRQPALGDHGKCYYHGGAPGSGSPTG